MTNPITGQLLKVLEDFMSDRNPNNENRFPPMVPRRSVAEVSSISDALYGDSASFLRRGIAVSPIASGGSNAPNDENGTKRRRKREEVRMSSSSSNPTCLSWSQGSRHSSSSSNSSGGRGGTDEIGDTRVRLDESEPRYPDRFRPEEKENESEEPVPASLPGLSNRDPVRTSIQEAQYLHGDNTAPVPVLGDIGNKLREELRFGANRYDRKRSGN